MWGGILTGVSQAGKGKRGLWCVVWTPRYIKKRGDNLCGRPLKSFNLSFSLFLLDCMLLGVDDSDCRHVDDVGNIVAALQDMDRLLGAHQDRAYLFGSA